MPGKRKSIYRDRLLDAVANRCTVDELAAALEVSAAHAADLLRYWERMGLVEPVLAAPRSYQAGGGRRSARYRLTDEGVTARREQRAGPGYAGADDLADALSRLRHSRAPR